MSTLSAIVERISFRGDNSMIAFIDLHAPAPDSDSHRIELQFFDLEVLAMNEQSVKLRLSSERDTRCLVRSKNGVRIDPLEAFGDVEMKIEIAWVPRTHAHLLGAVLVSSKDGQTDFNLELCRGESIQVEMADYADSSHSVIYTLHELGLELSRLKKETVGSFPDLFDVQWELGRDYDPEHHGIDADGERYIGDPPCK